MKPKYVHAITDEKFIEYARLSFELAALTEDKYIVVSEKTKTSFTYLSNFKGEILVLRPAEFKRALCGEGFCDVLVLHNLYSVPLEIIRDVPKRVKVVWFAWGFDIYSNRFPGYPLLNIGERYMPQTKELLDANKAFVNRAKDWIRAAASHISPKYSKACFEDAVRRIDFFSGVYEIEYDMMKQQVPFFRAEKILYNYSAMEEDIKHDFVVRDENDIMIGHCASPFCNHLDILSIVKERMDHSINKVICPLSYGTKGYYTDAVMSHGKRLFGDRFVPLTDFLPIDEYLNIVNRCAGMVLGLFQQSAVGNVIRGLSAGLNVYVPQKSMNYKFFSKLGTAIKSIEDDLTSSSFICRTTYDDVLRDRKILFDTFNSKETCINNIHSMVEIINKTI